MKLKRIFPTTDKILEIHIVGGGKDGDPYVKVSSPLTPKKASYIDDKKQLELLAVNILKLLKSKKIK